MRINKIEIDGFGKLNHVSLPFSDGFNLIVGDNESGKSTLCEFLLAMFYELPNALKKTTKYDDGRKLYRPWQGSAFGGRVYFTDDSGVGYVLEKSFGKTKTSDRAKLLYADTWEPAGDAAGAGERFFGLSREGFLKTLYVKSADARGTVGEEEIMARLSNLETGADEDISYERIKAAMEKAHGKIVTKTGRGGILPTLMEQKQALETEKAMLLSRSEKRKETEETAARLAVQEEELAAQRAGLEKTLALAKEHEAYIAEKQAIESREVLSARYKTECQRLTEMKARYAAFLKRAEGGVARGDLEKAKELERKRMLAAGRAEILAWAQKDAEMQAEASRKKKGAQKKVGILLSILGVCFGAALFMVSVAAAVGSAVALLAIGAVLCLLAKEPKEEPAGAEISQKEEETQLGQELDALLKRYGAESLAELEEKARSIAEIQRKLPEMAEDIKVLEKETEHILEGISKIRIPEPKAYAEEAKAYSGESVFELEEHIRKVCEKTDETKETLHGIRLELARETAGEKSVAQVESALLSTVEEIATLKRQVEAYRLAERWLERAHGEIKENFAPRLNKKTGEIFEAVTGGKYKDVRVGEGFALRYQNETGEITEGEALSRGTYDLLYISLRLATLKALFENRVPTLILDDAFSQLDDIRLKKAVAYMKQATSFGQVFYFTCHRESANILNKENINLIDLNEEGVLSDEQGL